MKISLDGGALCAKTNLHFGNYTFTQSLIDSIQKYDKNHEYFAYSFCSKPKWLKVNDKFHYKILRPSTLWLSTRVSIEEVQFKKDIFLALNQATPLFVKSKIISFSHGLSFYFYPHYYPDSYHALKDQLEPMIKKSGYIIVPSSRVKNEMEKIFPKYKNFKILNYGVPFDMSNYQPTRKKKYFLFVGMNHNIKNINFLIKVYKEFKKNQKNSAYKLFLIGNLQEFEDEENGIFTFSKVTREEVRKLYSEATAYLTTSFYESFNFPILEALAQNCPVIALKGAVIQEFRKYVYTADSYLNFLNHMEDISRNKSQNKKREEILKKFSWKKYISKLKELYDEIQL